MPLAYKVESLEGVDDAVKGLYVEKDGAYSLDVDLTDSGYEKVAGLKSAHESVKSERNHYRDKYNKLKEYEPLADIEGFDPSNINELMSKAASAGDPDAIEKIQRQGEKALEAERALRVEAEQKADSATSNMQNFIIDGVIKSDAIKAGVLPEGIDDVVALTRGNFKLSEGNKVIHIDDDGDPTGKTPSEFYSTDYKASKPHLYGGVDMSGSGSRKSTGGAGGKNMKRGDMSVKDKAAYIAEHGQGAFMALPK